MSNQYFKKIVFRNLLTWKSKSRKTAFAQNFDSQGNETFENADENLRQTLKEKHQKEGLQSLQQMLLEMDEEPTIKLTATP